MGRNEKLACADPFLLGVPDDGELWPRCALALVPVLSPRFGFRQDGGWVT